MQTARSNDVKPHADTENIVTQLRKHCLDAVNNELKTCVREAAGLQMHKKGNSSAALQKRKSPQKSKP